MASSTSSEDDREDEQNYPSEHLRLVLGIGGPIKGTKYLEYASEEARMNSFKTWPVSIPQKRKDLVAAGFFYTTKDDTIACHHCGIALRGWKAKHDPWAQHAKWSRNCQYVLTCKGQTFIDTINRIYPIPISGLDLIRMKLPSYFKKPGLPETSTSSEESESNDSMDDSGPSEPPKDTAHFRQMGHRNHRTLRQTY